LEDDQAVAGRDDAIMQNFELIADAALLDFGLRMQTARVPGTMRHSSTISSPKKWLFPEPRPPYVPL
jgi:hypothetical protein